MVGHTIQLGLTFHNVVDTSGRIGALYRVTGVPSHYFIAADGSLTHVEVGALSEATMTERIQC